jgi:hypothetical protein
VEWKCEREAARGEERARLVCLIAVVAVDIMVQLKVVEQDRARSKIQPQATSGASEAARLTEEDPSIKVEAGNFKYAPAGNTSLFYLGPFAEHIAQNPR